MNDYFYQGGPVPYWIRVAEEAISHAASDRSDRSDEAIIATMQRISIASDDMNMYCFDCNKQVYFGSKCSETGRYHMSK